MRCNIELVVKRFKIVIARVRVRVQYAASVGRWAVMLNNDLIPLCLGASCACLVTLIFQAIQRSYENELEDVAHVSDTIIDTIGNTPLVRIKSLSEFTGVDILGKAEYLNPFGSSKDRIVKAIVPSSLPKHTKVFEGTSGSTGISLSLLCRALGYEPHIVIPEDVSEEKRALLALSGAVLHVVKPASIVDNEMYVNKARAMALESNGFFVNQFESPRNWQAHFETTGPEIYRQCNARIDAFVCGVGTGGSLTGIAKYLQSRKSAARIILADPQGSSLYNFVRHKVMHTNVQNEGSRRRHQVDSLVEGIGLSRTTANFQAGASLVDDAIQVADEEAFRMLQYVRFQDGLLLGTSSGVNLVAAFRIALEMKSNGRSGRIVTLLCDGGERHASIMGSKVSNDCNIEQILEAKGKHVF